MAYWSFKKGDVVKIKSKKGLLARVMDKEKYGAEFSVPINSDEKGVTITKLRKYKG